MLIITNETLRTSAAFSTDHNGYWEAFDYGDAIRSKGHKVGGDWTRVVEYTTKCSR